MHRQLFVSDTHFGHAAILSDRMSLRRPFASIQEHDEALIARWNLAVRPDDTVWHLGDFCYRCSEAYARDVFRRLNGRRFLVRGNHEKIGARLPWDGPIVDVARVVVQNSDGTSTGLWLSHYAHVVWLRVGTVEILNLILDDRLAWVGRHTTGRRYGDLLIDRDEILGVIQEEGSPDEVSEPEAAAMLVGVDPKKLWCLVREGMLEWSPGYRPRDPRSVRALTRASVEAFAFEFVTLQEAAVVLSLAPQKALRRLAQAGIADAAPYDRVRMKLYRRRDLAACRLRVDAA